ncbi:MAG: ABC transporter ATP-binding protein [Gemmatimonadetes bacterium]|nr:ABC transporter ATP-binding protein [Gemmatimonadota bacterium]
MALVEVHAVTKEYPGGERPFTALSEVSLSVDAGEFVTVVGPSGSGKSTLLSMLAGIDRPSSGAVQVGGVAVHALGEAALSAWRGRAVGIVFQFFQLLPTLTVAENVMLPMDFADRWPAAERRPRAEALLARLGIADQAEKFPGALSGGQQQRVAVARALANEPPVILADEPTGNLDSASARGLLTALAELRADGHAVIMATHEPSAERFATRTVRLSDGRMVR